MSILKQLLGLGAEPEKKEAKQAGDTETVRKIVA